MNPTVRTSDSSPQPNDVPTYTINHSSVSITNHHKDLGVIMTSNLSWSRHHHRIITRAYRSLGLIRRSFSTNCTYTKRQLYLSLIRSQLTYCSPIWRPHLLKDINLLERVQKRATKYILNDYTSDYKSRLKSLQLLPLMYFFELNDIMFFIKSLQHPTDHFNIRDYILKALWPFIRRFAPSKISRYTVHCNTVHCNTRYTEFIRNATRMGDIF